MDQKNMEVREAQAAARLENIGELEHARNWISQNPPPADWTGTGLEYAELEMGISPLKGMNQAFKKIFG